MMLRKHSPIQMSAHIRKNSFTMLGCRAMQTDHLAAVAGNGCFLAQSCGDQHGLCEHDASHQAVIYASVLLPNGRVSIGHWPSSMATVVRLTRSVRARMANLAIGGAINAINQQLFGSMARDQAGSPQLVTGLPALTR